MSLQPPISVARVVIDSPLPQLDRPFDYAIPSDLQDHVTPGVLVRVPLRSGKRQVLGYVIDIAPVTDFEGVLAPLTEVVSAARILPSSLYALARDIADRQVGTVSDVLRQAIPRRYVRAEKAFLNRPVMSTRPSVPAVTRGEGDLSWDALRGQRVCVRATMGSVTRPDGHDTAEWSLLLATLGHDALAAGESSLLVVPDFRDVSRLVADLEALGVGDALVRLDSDQPPADRWVNYLRCTKDDPVIVVGNRSAIYAPMSRPGLIVVWDDGDPVYAEQLAPYTHARDVALLRQERTQATLVLVADSPSTDVVRLVEVGWLRQATPTTRRRHVIPLDNMTTEGASRIPSVAWRAAVEAVTRGPVLIQVARPGFSGLSVCSQCRRVARCALCGGGLRRRSRGAAADCRWCGALATQFKCPDCHATELRDAAFGSDATAEHIGKSFPGYRIVISSSDHLVTEIEPQPQIVVSTPGVEPFCPGGYAAVIILDADRQLLSDRLRVTENALRVWTHASAHAADGAKTYIVGTGARLGQVLATGTQWPFIQEEVNERRALHLPPSARVATITGPPAAVSAAVEAIPSECRFPVLGPIPADEGNVRVVIPFPYRYGDVVTDALRASVLRESAGPRRGRQGVGLRVRLDEGALERALV